MEPEPAVVAETPEEPAPVAAEEPEAKEPGRVICLRYRVTEDLPSRLADDPAEIAHTLFHRYKAMLTHEMEQDTPISRTDAFKNTLKILELRIAEIRLLLESRTQALKKD
jgi:hypothetical protein